MISSRRRNALEDEKLSQTKIMLADEKYSLTKSARRPKVLADEKFSHKKFAK